MLYYSTYCFDCGLNHIFFFQKDLTRFFLILIWVIFCWWIIYVFQKICVMLNRSYDHLLPLALSNFLPSALTRGAVCDPFWPGQRPKCLFASLSLGPLRRTTFLPLGANWASWSKVRQLPFAAVILALAPAVNLRATTLSPSGRVKNRASLVTVPMMATILLNLLSPCAWGDLSWDKCLTILEMEIG